MVGGTRTRRSILTRVRALHTQNTSWKPFKFVVSVSEDLTSNSDYAPSFRQASASATAGLATQDLIAKCPVIRCEPSSNSQLRQHLTF